MCDEQRELDYQSTDEFQRERVSLTRTDAERQIREHGRRLFDGPLSFLGVEIFGRLLVGLAFLAFGFIAWLAVLFLGLFY